MADFSLLTLARRAYRVLLYTYPSDFRRRYGKEMEQAFCDRCRDAAGLRELLRIAASSGADWVGTTVREGVASMGGEAQAADPVLDGVPVFYLSGSYWPPSGSLMNGVVLSLAIFSAVGWMLGHSRHNGILMIGSHHPSRSHLLPARTAAVPTSELESEIKVHPYPDELPMSPYFRLILVLGALDADRDNVISAAEMANASRVLRLLDKNHDGTLTAEECGLHFGDASKLNPEFVNRARLGFMRFHPALAALDADHDGQISGSEIKRASAALTDLDTDGDGALSEIEVLPVEAGQGAGRGPGGPPYVM